MVVTRTLQLLIRMPEVPSFVNAYTARSSQTQRSLLDADCNRCPRFPTPPHCGSVSVCKRGSGSTKLVACKEFSLQIVNPPPLATFLATISCPSWLAVPVLAPSLVLLGSALASLDSLITVLALPVDLFLRPRA